MSGKLNVLVADDNLTIREAMGRILRKSGFGVLEVADGLEALETYRRERPFLSILDLRMPGLSGIEVLRKIKEIDREALVIILTAFADMDTTISAMKLGAYDFFRKEDLDIEEISAVAEKAATAYRLLENEPKDIVRDVSGPEEGSLKIIGESASMQAIFKLIGKLAMADSVTVLITGESGSGKEMVARAIHQNSPRASKPFIAINCTAIPESLFERELFGHEKGAFTGADSRKPGKFEIADGGTIFLDEVAEMKEDMQVKLLRILQDRKFERVGGTETLEVDVRIIAATNVNLEEALARKKLREDLYHRLKVVTIDVPPLRERKEDIEPLARHFFAQAKATVEQKILAISEETMELLKRYDWPGNVRELKHAIESAVAICRHTILLPEHLPVSILQALEQSNNKILSSEHSKNNRQNTAIPSDKNLDSQSRHEIKSTVESHGNIEDLFIKLSQTIDEIIAGKLEGMGELEEGNLHSEIMAEVEKRLISRALEKFKGNQLKTAKFLGINRNTLSVKIDKYDIRI